MREGPLKFSRVLAAVIVGVLLSSTAPALFLGEPVVENAAAAPGYYAKVGFLQDFQNWNPLNIEFVSDYVACYLMFSVLFQYTEDWTGPVGDLATSWYQENHPSGNMTLHVNITQNAYFRNIVNLNSKAHQLTAADVAFTINLIKANEGGAWDIYLEDVTGANATSTFSVAIDVAFPKATILDNLVWIPIIPQYLWGSEPNPLGAKKPDWLVGSGPFVYNSSLKTQWYRFTRAPVDNYHGSIDYPVGDPRGDRVIDPGIEGIVYRYYSDDTLMVAAMNNGELDAIDLSGSPNLYLNELAPEITKMVTKEMGIIDIAVNGIPMDFRSTKQGGYAQGNPILLDPIVRKAIHMTLNKDFISNNLMQGLTTPAQPVLSPGFWQADIQNKITYGPAAAKALLLANGYAEGAGGYLFTTATSYPVLQGWVAAGTRLEFNVHAPDTDPSYETIGLNWVGWAQQAGIMFNYETKSEAIMTNSEWYKSNYDIWVWSWYWGPEPLSNLAVWTTDQLKPGGDNCQGPMGPWWYSAANSTTGSAYSAYDENFSAAEREFNETARKVLVDKLQQFVYDSYCEMPPIYPAGLYAVSTQRVTGWGNWTQHLGRSVSSDLPWVWFDLVPKGGNQMPEFDLGLDPSYQFVINETQTFTISVHDPDNDEINITWNFGDGTTATNHSAAGSTVNPVTFKQTHLYATLAMPPNGLDMNVTVSDGNAGGNATSYATVYVFPYPDSVPELTGPILSDPYDRAYINEDVIWTASARDLETGGGSGWGLEMTWDWGDGTTTSTVYQPATEGGSVTDTQTHNWSIPGPYDVTLYVWDGSLWPGHNVSMGTIPFMVVLNEAPTAPEISTITGNRNVWIDCAATASDIDGDGLRFTWNFSDGATNTYNVTEVSSSIPGAMVLSTAMHQWTAAGSYVVQVSVDDLTGMPGHNVTSSVTAVISNTGAQVPPSSLALIPTPQTSYPDEVVTFVASAVDTNQDPLTMYLEFGDGNSSTNTSSGGTTQRQFTTFTHSYADPGVYAATLWVDDGTGRNVSLWINLTVKENEAPWLILPSYATAYYNKTFTLTPSRARDNDTDPLVLWFDWGDGEWSSSDTSPFNSSHVYEVAGDVEIIVWADDGTGLPGHNVSKNITITVNENFKPTFDGEILKDPSKAEYKQGETVMFVISVKDYEGDMVNITVDFGDGVVEKIPMFRPEPNNVTVRYINHTFEKGRSTPYTVTATVDDGQEMYRSDPTWNTRSTTVLVQKKASSSALLIGIVIAVVVILAVLIFFLMKRKKGPKEEAGGMEGMKPPVEQIPPPPKK